MIRSPVKSQRTLALLQRSLATHAPLPEKSCASITPPYAALIENLKRVRNILKRPLTLAEKILYSHLVDPEKSLSGGGKIRGEAYLQLRPQRVAMQDASAQCVFTLALLVLRADSYTEWHCGVVIWILEL